MQENWYRRWFGERYKSLYPHRDEAQARAQVAALAQACGARPGWRVLDVGCGSGRHLGAFRALGFARVSGIDLSQVLLRDARSAGLAVARADMRGLPFPDGSFDLLGCFFTSFGYFETFEEDVGALREFRRVLRPGAWAFLDLHNAAHVRKHLVASDCRKEEGRTVEQTRRLEGDRVVKRIRIVDGTGREEWHEERVRLFVLADLEPALGDLGLGLVRIFGDEKGGEYRPDKSPRMGLLLRRGG